MLTYVRCLSQLISMDALLSGVRAEMKAKVSILYWPGEPKQVLSIIRMHDFFNTYLTFLGDQGH